MSRGGEACLAPFADFDNKGEESNDHERPENERVGREEIESRSGNHDRNLRPVDEGKMGPDASERESWVRRRRRPTGSSNINILFNQWDKAV
jgi:hypothetical protein